MQVDLAALQRRYEALQAVGAPPPPQRVKAPPPHVAAMRAAEQAAAKAQPPEVTGELSGHVVGRSTAKAQPPEVTGGLSDRVVGHPVAMAARWKSPPTRRAGDQPAQTKARSATPLQPSTPPPPEMLARKGIGKGKQLQPVPMPVPMPPPEPPRSAREKAAAAAIARQGASSSQSSQGGVEPSRKWCDYPVDVEDNAELFDGDEGLLGRVVERSTAKAQPPEVTGGLLGRVVERPDDSDSPVSDLDTMKSASDSSRLSKSRMSATRGPARAAKRREKLLSRAKAQAIAEGREWVEAVTHDVFKEQQRRAMFVDTLGREGSPWVADCEEPLAAEVIEAVLDKADEMKFTKDDLWQLMEDHTELFKPRWIKDPSQRSISDVERRYTVQKDVWASTCTLCDKETCEAHRCSAEHQKRVRETAAGDELIGPCSRLSRRRFSGGLCGALTAAAMKEWWGNNVETMVALTWDKLNKGSCFEFSLPGWGSWKKRVTAEETTNIQLGSIMYKGDGKYDEKLDKVVLWDHMTLIDPRDAPKLLQGRSWWPVCVVSWVGEHKDLSFWGTDAEYRSHQARGLLPVFVICWYQLFDNDWVMILWPVMLHPPSRL